jgi:hypothetical protein
VAALCLNPYGPRLLAFPLQMQSSWIRAIGPEWQSPFTSMDWASISGGRFFPHLMPILFDVYLALVVITLIQQVRRWRHVDLVPIAVMSGWVLLACWHIRAVLDAVVLTAPFLAASLQTAWGRQRWICWVGISGLVALTTVGLWIEGHTKYVPWMDHEPRGVVAWVQTLPCPVRVFGSTNNLWFLYRRPDCVQVHATWDFVIGPVHDAELRAVWQGRAPWGPFLERYHINVILLEGPVSQTNLAALHRIGWTRAYADDRHVALVRSARHGR